MRSIILTLLIFTTQLMMASAVDSVAAAPAEVHTKGMHKHKIDNEIFINTTYFVKQIISLSNANLEISPYILGYKLFPSKHHGIRLSIGGNWSNRRQNPDTTFVQIKKSSEIDYRIGYEYRLSFGKRWGFFAGVDFTNSFSSGSTRTNSSADILTIGTKSTSFGGGPVVGIEVKLGKRISLFTETAFYYKMSTTRTNTTSLNFAELNANRLTDVEQTGSFLLPTSLYFVFRF